MKFVKLNDLDRKRLFENLKRGDKSWNDLAKELRLSRAMIFNYINGSFPIPIEIYEEISRISGIKVPVIIVEKKRYLKKEIIPPKLDEELAEILGALNGDGHLSGISNEISVTCSRELDREYIFHLKELFEKKFGISFKIVIQGGAIRIRTYCKELVEHLNKRYGLPIGKKKNNLVIPKPVKENPELLRAYIRGLFDTDGSIYVRRKKDFILEIISVDKRFLEELKMSLKGLGFECGTSGKNLYFYQKNMIKRFFDEIKPANSKHLKKYWISFGLNAPVV